MEILAPGTVARPETNPENGRFFQSFRFHSQHTVPKKKFKKFFTFFPF